MKLRHRQEALTVCNEEQDAERDADRGTDSARDQNHDDGLDERGRNHVDELTRHWESPQRGRRVHGCTSRLLDRRRPVL